MSARMKQRPSPAPWLDGKHTIFGRTTKSMDVLQSLSARHPQSARRPGDEPVTVEMREGG